MESAVEPTEHSETATKPVTLVRVKRAARRFRLTDRLVASLKLNASGQFDTWDTDVRGFGIRVSGTPERPVKTFNVLVRIRGKLKRISLGNGQHYPDVSLADARKEARHVLGQIAAGSDPTIERDARREAGTVGTLVQAFLEAKRVTVKPSTLAEMTRILNKEVVPAWGNRKVTNIAKIDIRALLEGINKRGPTMALNTHAWISSMLHWAHDQDWIAANPCAGMKRIGSRRKRDRVLTNDEIRKLHSALDRERRPDPGIFVLLELLTAQRQGEIRQMRYADLELPPGVLEDAENAEQAWWTIPADIAKNGVPNRVPLSRSALALVRPFLLERRGEWVFPSPARVDGPWSESALDRLSKRLKARTGIHDATLHDLRRTAATKLAEGGFRETLIDALLNHVKDVSVVQETYIRYSYAEEKQQMVGALERIFNGILAGKDASAKVLAFSSSKTA